MNYNNGLWVLQDEDAGLWGHDGCNVTWCFINGGPRENEAYYCPKCGKKLLDEPAPDGKGE